MSGGPGREHGAVRVWLRIGLAAAVVAGLMVATASLDDPDSDSGVAVSEGRADSQTFERCAGGEARRAARVWFRGMSSGDPDRVAAVTSRGRPVPRYVIEVGGVGEVRTVRIVNRASAAATVPGLVDTDEDLRLFEISRIGRPPKARDGARPLTGRLAGVEFRARVGESRWGGRLGVRCVTETAYYAAFRISAARLPRGAG